MACKSAAILAIEMLPLKAKSKEPKAKWQPNDMKREVLYFNCGFIFSATPERKGNEMRLI